MCSAIQRDLIGPNILVSMIVREPIFEMSAFWIVTNAWALSTPDDRAFVVGRKPFGRIVIANADAAGSSHTDAAIDMAWRAVGEVVESRTRRALSNLTRSISK